MSRRAGAAALLAAFLCAAAAARADERRDGRERVLLDVVEGRVAAIDARAPAGSDGDADDLVVLRLDGDARGYALAPAAALSELGFEVRVGDRVRMRFFLRAGSGDGDGDEDGERVLPVQKALNLSRDRMLRLRTLYRDPLWERGGEHRDGEGRGPHGPREHPGSRSGGRRGG